MSNRNLLELPPLPSGRVVDETNEATAQSKLDKRRSKSWDITPIIPKVLKKSRSQSLNQQELADVVASVNTTTTIVDEELDRPVKRKKSYILFRRSIVDRIFAPTHPEKNIQDTEPIFAYTGHTSSINCLYPYTNKPKDEIKLYTASNDKTIREWAIEKGICTKVFEGHSSRVIGIIIDRTDEGDTMYSCSHDNTLKAWNLETAACLRTFNGHTDQISCFGICDELLCSGSIDKTIRLWNKKTGEILATIEGHTDAISALQVINLNNKRMLYSSSIDNTLRAWDISSDNIPFIKEPQVIFKGHTDWIWCLKVVDNHVYTGSKDCTIRQWDLLGNCVYTYEGHTHSVFRLLVHKEKLYSASWDGTIRIWDTKTKKMEHVLQGHHSKIQAFTMDPEAEVLYSGAVDGSIRAWSMQGKLLRVYAGHTEAVNFLWDPSKYGVLISASTDKSVKLWLPTNCYGRTIQIDLSVNPANEEGAENKELKEDYESLTASKRMTKQELLGVTNNGNIYFQ